MKTAREWEGEMDVHSVEQCREFIRQVQADALRHCEAKAVRYAANAIDGKFSAAGYAVARLIEKEIYKLSEKEDA